jgi:hypothetical protein
MELPDIRLNSRLLARFGASVQSDMDRRKWRSLLRVEILNQGGIGVQIGPC